MSVDTMIEALIGREGRYSNHPSDTGGETMWGITIAVARANGYTGAMKDMPRPTAKRIYLNKYYILPGFSQVEPLSAKVAEELFDTGVNMGPSIPAAWFQRVLNALNAQGTLWGDIGVDGDIGPKSLNAYKSFQQRRGTAKAEEIMLKALNCLQGARYIELAEGRGKNEDFLFGWLNARVEL